MPHEVHAHEFPSAATGPTLASLLAKVEADPALPTAKRASWAWALRAAGKYLGRPLESLPASMLGLRFGIGRLHHAQLGVSRKSLQNWRSTLRAVITHYTDMPGLPHRGLVLAPAWQSLYDRLPDANARRGLIRLMRYCTASGIAPAAVDDGVVAAFIEFIGNTTFTRKLNGAHRQACVLWNRASASIPDWPKTRLAIPNYRPARVCSSWEELPATFQADVAAYLRTRTAPLVGAPDLAALLDGPGVRPWAPSTAGLRREHIRLAASAAMSAGFALESLADLVRPNVVEAILSHYLKRDEIALGRKAPKTFTIDLAYSLLSIARDWTKPPPHELERLAAFSRNLEKHRATGMTPKNMKLIRSVMEPGNKARLLALPERLMQEAATMSSYKAAVTAQFACAITILLVAPMRLKNLLQLRLGVEFLHPGGPDAPAYIHIPDFDVKNNVPLEYPLPRSTTKLVDKYVATFRPRLVGSESTWLFPGEAGHKLERTLSDQLRERIFKEIGIRISPHQFRHAAAAWLLQATPGNYELVRRVLGHKALGTTTRFYVAFESMSAMLRYHEILATPPGEDGAVRP